MPAPSGAAREGTNRVHTRRGPRKRLNFWANSGHRRRGLRTRGQSRYCRYVTSHQRSVRVPFETSRLELAKIRSDGDGAKRSAYEIACRLSATTLGVERVSIWVLDDALSQITCATLYQRSTDSFDRGTVIQRATCPHYFDALLSRRVIAADDALTDPKTAELRAYLKSNGIGALLDAPLYRDGSVVGVVCHEHCGAPRRWRETEAGFASSVADMLTILVEQAEQAELRAALAAQRLAEASADKMTALQRLARVVAHDLNNVLTVAVARTQLLGEGANSEDVPNEAAEVGQVLAYGARLVQQLSAFSEAKSGEPTTELRQLLASLEPSLRALMGKSIEFVIDVQPGTYTVAVPSVEAEQLLLNLCMNAADAIKGEAGHVTIQLGNEPITGSAELQVTDSGVGMDEATQSRIFEPYYSTKSNHQGVGLMAVYGIVQRAGGAIAVESAPGAGTRFRIVLPRTNRVSQSSAAPWEF